MYKKIQKSENEEKKPVINTRMILDHLYLPADFAVVLILRLLVCARSHFFLAS